MATRYSGTLRITIALKSDDSYSVRISELNDDARFAPLHGIGIAPALANRVALDSSEAYDAAAVAALGFASYEDEAVYRYAEYAPKGAFLVRRKR